MWFGANIEDIRGLKEGNEEMSAFADGNVENSAETVHEDGALAAVNSVERGVDGGGSDSETEGGAGDVG